MSIAIVCHAWRRRTLVCLLALGACWAQSVRAEGNRAPGQAILAAAVLPGEAIPLDARLTHPAWQRAIAFSGFVEREPVNGDAPKFETRVQVLVDRNAVLVAVTALDPDSSAIREELVRHDLVRRTQDFVTLYLDPVGRRSSAQLFRVGVGGSTTDGMHTAEDDTEDLTPDFDWDSDVYRSPSGYNILFRIPFASLRYTEAGTGPWRIMVVRRVPRGQVYQLTSTFIPADSPSFISAMQPLEGVEIPKSDSFLTVRPNVTMRNERLPSADGKTSSQTTTAVGVDLKWRPFSEFVVDATIHPDFSQVELDVPQLSRNTTFALFNPEKRPFFLESSDLLRSPLLALSTRSVTRPAWGFRGTLRMDSISGTAFVARDKGAGIVLLPNAFGTNFADQPASYAAAARMRSDTDTFSIGGIASVRRFDDGVGDNVVAGPDMTWQASDNLQLRLQWLTSSTTALPDENYVLRRGTARIGQYGYMNVFWRTEGYEANGIVESSTDGFRDDNGFISQVGVVKYGGVLRRILHNVGALNELTFSLSSELVRDKKSGSVVSGNIVPEIYASYANNSEVTIEYHGLSRVRLEEASPLLAEKYLHVAYGRNVATWMPQITVALDIGSLADVVANAARSGTRLSVLGKFRLGRQVEFEVNASDAQLRNSESRVYHETAVQLLGVWHMAARQSLRLISQRTSLNRGAEPTLGIDASVDRGRADSLTYAWRKTAGSVLYVGATRVRTGTALNNLATEVFVKLQVDAADVLSFK